MHAGTFLHHCGYALAATLLAAACLLPAGPPAGTATQPGITQGSAGAAHTSARAEQGVTATANALMVAQPLGRSTRIAQYTPVPGVSGLQLYEHLHLARPAGASITAVDVSYDQCAYAYLGTATTLCPMLHWSNDGNADPQVYFVDHTGNSWPVQTTTQAWNRAPNINLHYTTGACPAGAHCVNVWAGNYGNSCWQGLATWDYDGNGNFIDGTVNIYLNDFAGVGDCQGRYVDYSKNAAGYQQDVCHEQGHTLGLDHNRGDDSCLSPDIVDSPGMTTPDAADLALLGWLYSSPH